MKYSLLILILLLFLPVSGCDYYFREKIVKIGVIGEFTGPNSLWDRGTRDGLVFAVKKSNSMSQIPGTRIMLCLKDLNDYKTPEELFKEFQKEGIDIVMGPALSARAVRLVPFAEKSGILLFSASASTTELKGKDDLFIRSIHGNRDIASFLSAHIHDKEKIKSISTAWSSSNRENNENWRKAFMADFSQRGGKENLSLMIDDSTDFNAAAKKMVSTKPDGILICGPFTQTGKLIKSIKQISSDMKIIVNSEAAVAFAPRFYGKDGQGIITAKPFLFDFKNKEFLSLNKAFKKDYSYDINYRSILGYDAGSILIKGLSAIIKKGFEPSAQSLKEEIISKGRFKTPMGDVKIDKFGDAKRNLFILTIKNGKYVRK